MFSIIPHMTSIFYYMYGVQNVKNLRIFFPNSTQPLAEDATFNLAHQIPFMKTTNKNIP